MDSHDKADGVFCFDQLRRQGQAVLTFDMEFRFRLALEPVHAQLHPISKAISTGGDHGAGPKELGTVPSGAAPQKGI